MADGSTGVYTWRVYSGEREKLCWAGSYWKPQVNQPRYGPKNPTPRSTQKPELRTRRSPSKTMASLSPKRGGGRRAWSRLGL